MNVCNSCENNVKIMMTLFMIAPQKCELLKKNQQNNINKTCMELLAIEMLKKDYDVYQKAKDDNDGFK